ASAPLVDSLRVTAIGRDLFTLIGLIIVMVLQDPVLSVVSFIFVPPALLMLRKLIRRISAVARNRFTGGARILETMQETVQGIRIIKAYTLEGVMQAKVDADIAALERDCNTGMLSPSRAAPIIAEE